MRKRNFQRLDNSEADIKFKSIFNKFLAMSDSKVSVIRSNSQKFLIGDKTPKDLLKMIDKLYQDRVANFNPHLCLNEFVLERLMVTFGSNKMAKKKLMNVF